MTSPVPSKGRGIIPLPDSNPKKHSDDGVGPLQKTNLSLPLFVFRVSADYPDYAAAMDDLAFVANLFY
jgi:hypothetical protein